jgi:hypothetical protein
MPAHFGGGAVARTIGRMKAAIRVIIIFLITAMVSSSLLARTPSKAVTVPVTLDHNRVVIDVYVPLKDGSTKRIRGLVDTGRSEVKISQRVAQMLGGTVSCDGQMCSTSPPQAILIGGMRIPLSPVVPAKVPMRPDNATDVLIPGMSPEIVIPSSVLASYDLVIDYANRQFTIGEPDSVKFTGAPNKATVLANGMLTVMGKVSGSIYNFGIDTGSSATLAQIEQFTDWHKRQPAWPYALGALGAANMTGGAEELRSEMLRMPILDLGASTLPDVLVASTDKAAGEFEKTHGQLTGTIGGEAFKGMRIGIDYAHSSLYIERINDPPKPPGLDVVGLTLRPEVNGRYTVMSVALVDGKPAVLDVRVGDVLIGVDGAPVTGATMGQVWSLLGGEPGQTRKLILERDGKRLPVEATVRRFLPSPGT